MRRFPLSVGVSGAVRMTSGYSGDYCIAIGRSDRLFYYNHTQTENIKYFERRVVRK